MYVCVWEGGAVSYTAELLSITVYLNNTVDFKHGAYEVQGRCAGRSSRHGTALFDIILTYNIIVQADF